MAEWVKDLELPLIRDKSCHPREDANWICSLTQWVKDPTWLKAVAKFTDAGQIQLLARKLPCATGVALKRK